MFRLFVLLTAFAVFHPSLSYAIETKAKQAIVLDVSTHTVLFAKNADEKMHPSSMSKLMTVYEVFKRLKEGRLKPDDTLPVSEKAWRMQGSKMWVELGNRIPVQDLLQGIIVQSGNDACVVMAEGLAGSEEAFAQVLNEDAQKLGLTNSHFVNASGWPDDNHLMSAHDLATLAMHLIEDFPEYYPYFSEREFTYHKIRQPNRNVLLGGDLNIDGLKTGHTEDGGYGIVISGKQGDRRIVVVVNGLTSDKERAQEAEALLRTGFRDFENVNLLPPGKPVGEVDVWMGERLKVPVVAQQPLVVTLPHSGREKVEYVLSYMGPVPAPVEQGAHIADLKIKVPGREPMLVPLVAAEPVKKLSPFARIIPALSYYLTGK